jgi:hypothetical protein
MKKSTAALPTVALGVADDARRDGGEAIALRSLLGPRETPAPSLVR